MNEQKHFIRFADLVIQLENVQLKKESGAFFIVTDQSRSASLIFNKGQLVDARFGPKKGNAALELIKQINLCTVRFDSNFFITDQGSGEILNSGVRMAWDDAQFSAQLAVIEQVLSRYLGPAARRVIEEEGKCFDKIEDLLHKLTMELDIEDEKAQFMREVLIELSNTNVS